MPPAGQATTDRRLEAVERKVDDIARSLEGDDGMRVRLALLEQQSENRHTELMAAVSELKREVSDQGRAPPPVPPATPPKAVHRFELAPGSAMEIGKIVLVIGMGLGLWGASGLIKDAPEPDPVVIPARVAEPERGDLVGLQPDPTP